MSHAFSFEVLSSSALEASAEELARVRKYSTELLCELLNDEEFSPIREALRTPTALELSALPVEITGGGFSKTHRLVVTVEPYQGPPSREVELGRRGVELLLRALHADRTRTGYRRGWDWVSPKGPTLSALLATIAERDAVTELFRELAGPPNPKKKLKARARPLRNSVYRRLRLAQLRDTGQLEELVNLQLAYGFSGAKVQRVFLLSQCLDDVGLLRSKEGIDVASVEALCRKADGEVLSLLARIAAGAPPELKELALGPIEEHLRKPSRWSRNNAASAVHQELGADAEVLARFATLLEDANKK